MRNVFIVMCLMLCIGFNHCGEALTLKIDGMLREYRAQDRFSGTVMVAEDGNEIYYQGFGFVDRAKGIPNTSNQKLKIGSIVKDFTAVLILQMADQGLLTIDDTIGTYLADFSEKIRHNVTIRQLLRHEAGFGDYLRIPGVLDRLHELKSVDDIMQIIKTQPLRFAPGSNQSYSNSGYVVLGAIAEQITGKPYAQLIKEHILNPLKMRDTDFDWQSISEYEEPPQWYVRSSTGKFYTAPHKEWPSPSGGAYSTGRDLLRFEQALRRDTLFLSQKSRHIMSAGFAPMTKSAVSDRDEKSGISIKAGGSPGSNAVVLTDIGRGFTIIVLANFDEPIAEVIAENIHLIIQGKKYPAPMATIFEKVYEIYQHNGSDTLKNRFSQLVTSYNFQDPPDLILNRVGYDLLNEQALEQALALFLLNTELFPQVANTWDSLGEVYYVMQDYETAVKHYKKSLDLDPDNRNAQEMITRIKSE